MKYLQENNKNRWDETVNVEMTLREILFLKKIVGGTSHSVFNDIIANDDEFPFFFNVDIFNELSDTIYNECNTILEDKGVQYDG